MSTYQRDIALALKTLGKPKQI